MRILYVHERLGSLGGAEANALITEGRWKAKGHTVGLIHGAPTGKGEQNWLAVFESRYPLDDDGVVQDAIRDFVPDVIYVHKMPEIAVIEALVESGLPLIRMVHD